MVIVEHVPAVTRMEKNVKKQLQQGFKVFSEEDSASPLIPSVEHATRAAQGEPVMRWKEQLWRQGPAKL